MIGGDLLSIDRALRASWAAGTCSADDLARADWRSDNPAWGHCDIAALVVDDAFGGDPVVGEVPLAGEPQGFHWWNQLHSGVRLDLTREQFRHGRSVSAPSIVERPQGPLSRRWEEYPHGECFDGSGAIGNRFTSVLEGLSGDSQ